LPNKETIVDEIALIQNQLSITSKFIRKRYADRDAVAVSSKTDANDLLTEVDAAVQAMIIEAIHARFPDDAIVGEESGYDRMPADPRRRCWVIDPIDGTQNFVRGMLPVFGTSIGFMEEGELRAGGIGLPIPGDVFLAARGKGATRNGVPIRVKGNDSLANARLELDVSHQGHRPEVVRRFGGSICDFGQVRVAGAATIGLAAVACGEADAYLHVGLKLWDLAAGVLLVEEAGGMVTRLDGSAIDLTQLTTDLAVSNGAIHAEMLRGILPPD